MAKKSSEIKNIDAQADSVAAAETDIVQSKNSNRKQNMKLRFTKRTLRGWGYGYLFILPWIIGVFVFVVYPLVNSFNFSLNNIRITPKGFLFQPVGFKNYTDVFVLDINFPQLLLEFVTSTILQVPIIVAFALIISLLLNGKIKARGFFRGIFFLPVIIATGPVMNELVAQNVASVPMVNSASIAEVIGFLPQWIVDPIIDLFSSLILILWNSGVQILIFLSGLQKVSPEMYEAAKIDGASIWECFWKITVPVIKPMMLLNAVYTIVTLATSGQNQIITTIYTNMFASNRGYGFAAAQAWMYSVVIFILLGICYLLFKERKDKSLKESKKARRRGY